MHQLQSAKLGVRREIFNILGMHHNPYSTQSDSQNTKIGIPKPIHYSTAFYSYFLSTLSSSPELLPDYL